MIGDNMMDQNSNNHQENDLNNLPEEEDMDMDADYGLNDDQDGSVNEDAEGNNQIRKRRLMKKAPDAPKRFKSAYICFVTEKMDNVKKSMPADIKVTEVMKTLAYMWKNLPPLEKLEYEKQAEADKTRYFEEMAQYSGPLQVPNKRQKKPPGAPKRAMSAFLSFSQQMRPQIRAMYPDLKNTDISGVLAQKWHNATDEEKRPHLERELREREKYHEDMAQWKEDEQKRQQEAAEERKKNNTFVKNTVDFLDLPSSTSLWETLDSDGLSENVSEQNEAPEPSMPTSMASSSSASNHRMSSNSMLTGKELGNMYEHPFHSLASFHSGSALTNKLMGGLHKNYSGLQPKGSLKMNQDNGQSSRSKSNQNNNNNNNNNHNNNNNGNNSNNNMAAIPPSIAIPMNSSNSTTPTNNSSSALPTPMTMYSTASHPAAMTAAAHPENRYYAMQYPMVAHPEGQVPYASFSMYPQEYAPYMTYYVPNEKGAATSYVRYPYMGPLYARQFATAANQTQGEMKDEGLPLPPAAMYPGSYGYPGHPVFPPEYMSGASEGYWQYVRKMPTPSSSSAAASANNGNNNGSNKEAGSRAPAAFPHYLYELPPEYLAAPPVGKMTAGAAEKGMEFLPYPYAYAAAPLTASYPLPQTSGKSKKGQSHSTPMMKGSASASNAMGMMMGGQHPAPNGRQDAFQHSHSNVAETLRAIHRSGLSGQD